MDNNVYFRLKFERERLGLSQAVIAAQAEVALKTVGRWEKEIAIPSDKLSLLKKLGFDVLYVLLGERTEGLLSKDESLIINKYRQADHETQTKIHMLLLGGAEMPTGVVDQSGNTISGQQIGNNNEQTNNFNKGSSADQNIQGDVKIKAKGKRSQAAFNITNNDK